MAAAVESVVVVHNVGTLARSVTAFGIAEVVVVGRHDVSAFGSHATHLPCSRPRIPQGKLARPVLKLEQNERGCDICGVEISDDASTVFLLGNEGTGLSQKECDICEFFAYIPQYGGGTASLNITVAASILLHYFGANVGMEKEH